MMRKGYIKVTTVNEKGQIFSIIHRTEDYCTCAGCRDSYDRCIEKEETLEFLERRAEYNGSLRGHLVSW